MGRFGIVFAIIAALAVIAIMAGLGVILALAMANEDAAGARKSRAAAGEADPRVPGLTLLRRALARRCPRCGRGAVFARYFTMNPRCPECGAVFWVDRGEWLGAFVIDWAFATGTGIVIWPALELLFPQLGQAAVIAIVSTFVLASLFTTFPWSRSMWTVFLYLTGAMGERLPGARQDRSDPSH
jgi:uncharacterized protein (DUF983 family)